MKKTFVLIIFLVLFPFAAYAAPPTLFFSDITSVPKSGLGDGLGQGAIVTIWGVNLGFTQGESTVSIRDSAGVTRSAAYIYTWANATQQTGHPADLYTYHKMQYVQFSVPSASANGAAKVYVTVGGVASNELDLSLRSTGTIRFVKTTGTDSGAGSWSSPWRTLQYAVGGSSALAQGDVIYACNGVSSTNAGAGGSGVGVGRSKTATTDATSYALLAYPASLVTITSTSVGGGGVDAGYAEPCYWRFSRLKIVTNGVGFGPFGHGRFIANEIMDYSCSDTQAGAFYGQYNVDAPGFSQGLKILGNYIHNYGGSCSTNKHHVIYASLRNAPNPGEAWEIAYNHISDCGARSAIHFYDEGRCQGWSGTVLIHDNVVKNQEGVAFDINAGCDSGRTLSITAYVYENLFIETGGDPSGVGQNAPAIMLMHYPTNGPGPSGNVYIVNNTIYGYGRPGGRSGYDSVIGAWYLQTGGSPYLYWHFQNNIVVDTHNNPYYDTTAWTAPTTCSNNLWYNGGDGTPSGPPSWDPSALTSDPLFVNPSAGDFSFQANSPAKNAGIGASGFSGGIGAPRNARIETVQ